MESAQGEERSVDSLVDEVCASGLTLAEITGGEPLCQAETPLLCRRLLDAGIEVLLETNGSLSIASVPREVRKILDCKLPDSGMSAFNCYDNYALLEKHDEVKFVISSRRDFDFACEIIEKYALFERTPHLIASPVWGKAAFDELSSWVMESPLPWRMQLQMHKIIWGDRRGV
jgi:7-carboxy-7-deazaguanine synthase